MTYATREDMVQAYGEQLVMRLSKRPEDTTGAGAVAGALAYAASVIDAELSVRFALPLAEVPAVLRQVAVDLAVTRLPTSADTMTDELRRRSEVARKDLRAIAEGRMNLGLPARSPTDTGRPVLGPVAGLVGEASAGKLFTRGGLRDL